MCHLVLCMRAQLVSQMLRVAEVSAVPVNRRQPRRHRWPTPFPKRARTRPVLRHGPRSPFRSALAHQPVLRWKAQPPRWTTICLIEGQTNPAPLPCPAEPARMTRWWARALWRANQLHTCCRNPLLRLFLMPPLRLATRTMRRAGMRAIAQAGQTPVASTNWTMLAQSARTTPSRLLRWERVMLNRPNQGVGHTTTLVALEAPTVQRRQLSRVDQARLRETPST
mmetsp:Transcript_4511/g.13652  ORF Transcript_4511/g.13652 Transcript_4511/m.13652 type:complete len:224 (-) Transcript_4511:1840-2511(-)